VGHPARPGIVHRLDRDTSGLLVVARTQTAYDRLVDALAERRVERTYLALAWGTFDTRRGVIDAPIGRSTRRRTRMAVRDSGKEARTRYEVVEAFADPPVTLLECALESGRTHQIRVHLAYIHHPVLGDPVYGRRSPLIARPALHAEALTLRHPRTGKSMTWQTPPPDDFELAWNSLADRKMR
jgi:23S rRNA pseudouridine1911/1915/1917 synthase